VENVIPEYTYSTNGPGATVVAVQDGFDFPFNPLVAGDGIQLSQPTATSPITITSDGVPGGATLQSAYDAGNTITLATGTPIDISGDDQVIFSNNEVLIEDTVLTRDSTLSGGSFNTNYSNGGTFVDQDIVLNWPDPDFTGTFGANSIVYIRGVFLGYETTTGDSWGSEITLKYDPSIPDLQNQQLNFNNPFEIVPELNGTDLRFRLNGVITETYNVTWDLEVKVVNRP